MAGNSTQASRSAIQHDARRDGASKRLNGSAEPNPDFEAFKKMKSMTKFGVKQSQEMYRNHSV
jgi:hypothetical protein